ncbi:MAG: glycosyltransferase family 4 protein [Solirubrobacterales bacterium]
MSAPHVAVDMRILDRAGMERTGIGRYVLESALALRRARPDWRITAHTNRPDLIGAGGGIEVRSTRFPTASAIGRIAWLNSVASTASGPAPDLWFAPAFVSPPRWAGATVVTVHDLVFKLQPALYRGRLAAAYVERATRRSAKQAARVICPTDSIREQVVAELSIDPARAGTARWGVSEAFRVGDRGRESGDYVLFVGRRDGRKGFDVLEQALVLAADLGHHLDLRMTSGMHPEPSDAELAELYGGALALVYPSRMEGFGFPVAEAMACGCPVIASDLAEIREWSGDAPLFVEPGDAQALARSMISLAADPALGDRMRRAGLAEMEGRTWEAYGEQAASLIEQALGDQRESVPTTSP